MEGSVWTPSGSIIALCANVHTRAPDIGKWDMWFTIAGATVLSPCLITKDFSQEEVNLADYSQNVKIQRANTVVGLTNKNATFDPYVFTWIHMALAMNRPVLTDVPLAAGCKPVSVSGVNLLRELNLFSLDRDELAEHIRTISKPLDEQLEDLEEVTNGPNFNALMKEADKKLQAANQSQAPKAMNSPPVQKNPKPNLASPIKK